MASRWFLDEPIAPSPFLTSNYPFQPLLVSQLYYLLRSRADGRYLAARLRSSDPTAPQTGFLLVFRADYDALSYLSAHAPDVGDQFAVETITPSHLKPLLSRWNFQGLGMVQDPRLPDIEFFNRTPEG